MKCFALAEKYLLAPKPMELLTAEEQKKSDSAENCYLCNKTFTQKNYKVRDHDHFTGKYRGPACNNCNLKYTTPDFIPVYFHNLSGYDAHLFVKNLQGKLNVIASNSENYISLSKFLPITEDRQIEIRFLIYRLMQSSLDSLAKNLPDSEKKNLKKKFEDNFDLVNQKGFYPYEWVDSFEKFQNVKFPNIEDFDSKLNNTKISETDYQHAQKVWKEFNCKTFRDYHKIYLETDVLLLTDIVENFRETCLENVQLYPA
jgi:hypothetical protein